MTVIGERPSANSPRSTLVRNTATDNVGGPISEFKITENYPELAARRRTATGRSRRPGCEDLTRHILDLDPAGCGVPEHRQRAAATASASVAAAGLVGRPGCELRRRNSAAAGPARSPSTAARRPEAAGEAARRTRLRRCGPRPGSPSAVRRARRRSGVGVRLLGQPGNDAPCTQVDGSRERVDPSAYTLGYVQLTTISELANAVFGANAEATAAQAVNHQFDYAKGDCVSNTMRYGLHLRSVDLPGSFGLLRRRSRCGVRGRHGGVGCLVDARRTA